MIDQPVRLSLRIRVFAPVRIAMTVLCAALLFLQCCLGRAHRAHWR